MNPISFCTGGKLLCLVCISLLSGAVLSSGCSDGAPLRGTCFGGTFAREEPERYETDITEARVKRSGQCQWRTSLPELKDVPNQLRPTMTVSENSNTPIEEGEEDAD